MSVFAGARLNPGLLARPEHYFVGLDLGKAQDYTAVSVIERAELVYPERDAVTYDFAREVRHHVRHLERVPLQTPYPDVVETVRTLAESEALKGKSTVVVDATGVGAPVVDLLRRAGLGCGVVAVTITGGDSEGHDASGWRVPKRDLVMGLRVAFQKRWLRVGDCGTAGEWLVKELLATRVRVSETGHARFGAWTGHDDLMMATALAWWRLRRVWPAAGALRGRVV